MIQTDEMTLLDLQDVKYLHELHNQAGTWQSAVLNVMSVNTKVRIEHKGFKHVNANQCHLRDLITNLNQQRKERHYSMTHGDDGTVWVTCSPFKIPEPRTRRRG